MNGYSIARLIHEAYGEGRCFPFLPDPGIIHGLRRKVNTRLLWKRYLDVVANVYHCVSLSSRENGTVKEQPGTTHLLLTIIHLVHRSIAQLNDDILLRQRVVAVQAEREDPVIHHVCLQQKMLPGGKRKLLAIEIPTVYFDMRLFHIMLSEGIRGGERGIRLFKLLLHHERSLLDTPFEGFVEIPHQGSVEIGRLVEEATLTDSEPLHILERPIIEPLQTISRMIPEGPTRKVFLHPLPISR
jgi:hypothetical protein